MIHAQSGIDTVLIAPIAKTDGTTTTANLDTRNADYATIRVLISAEEGTDATPMALSLLHSDDTVVTNFATIVANVAPDLASGGSHRYEVDLRGKKRYLRLAVTAGTGTGSNVSFGAIATLTRNRENPASTSDFGNDTVTIVT